MLYIFLIKLLSSFNGLLFISFFWFMSLTHFQFCQPVRLPLNPKRFKEFVASPTKSHVWCCQVKLIGFWRKTWTRPPWCFFTSLFSTVITSAHLAICIKVITTFKFHFTTNFRGSMQAMAAHMPANAARRDIAFPPMECKTSVFFKRLEVTPLLRKQDTIIL